MMSENLANQGSSPPGGQIILYSEGQANINVRMDGETVWLTQRALAELYQVSIPTINYHLSGIYEEGELSPDRTIRKYLIVQHEGNRDVSRLVDHYFSTGRFCKTVRP